MATFLSTNRFYRQGARTLARDYFTSAEHFAVERERIFSRQWVCVGRERDIPEPGDFRLIDPAGESMLLVRDREGVVRALYNVCRHRGSRLCEVSSGRMTGSIRCPYHAWTYGLDGRLLTAPHMREATDFDQADWGLHTAQVAAWQGFLFVSLADAPVPLADSIAPMTSRVERFDLPRLRAAERIEYDVRANWKIVTQNYSECQHCPVIHPGLTRLSPYDSGANDLIEGPFLGGYMMIAEDAESMTASGRACGVPVGALPADDHRRVYYYSVFPNLLLSLHPDYVMFHTLWPLAPDRTRIVCEWLFHPDSLSREDCDPRDAVAFWDETNRQDWNICEQSQHGVTSRKYAPGPYSPRESLLAAWDQEYLKHVQGEG
ncbi:MAG TPA: aromatic ring-hydroxylating dioxygenase subunit alpha [Gemmatimonadaceae bacterium]|nr:aromatic ring-hydroxylating dioxygenase subunit alpha [Gemmatimonadaceae bacterium]